MKHLRHITSVLIIILIAVLAAGTIVEKLHGSDFARIHVYGAWWFVALWALMAMLIICMAVKCKTWKRLAVCALFIYAAPLHEKIWTTFQKPLFFHINGILAILSVVITYFGVNLLLGGIHAYN